MAQERVISERPRTAGAGCTTSFSRPRIAHKSSTDRLELRIPSQTMAYREGSQLFLFPSPSPRQQLPRSATFPTSSMASESPISSPRIGVALGSPSQARIQDLTYYNRENPKNTRLPIQQPPPPLRSPPGPPKQQGAETTPVQPQLKKKKSNWNAFRNMFNRKDSRHTANEPLNQQGLLSDRPNTSSGTCLRDLPFDGEQTLLLKVVNGRVESNTTKSRSGARLMARAEADVANIRRNQGKPAVPSPSLTHVDKLQPWYDLAEIEKGLDDVTCKDLELDRRDSPLSDTNDPTCERSPRLDSRLPDPGMDRYSVMFEKLVVVDGPKMSLLERRRTKMLYQNPTTQLEPFSEYTQNDEVSRGAITSPQSARLPLLPLRVDPNNGTKRAKPSTDQTKPTTKSTIVSSNQHAPSLITKDSHSPAILSTNTTPSTNSKPPRELPIPSTTAISHISTTHLIIVENSSTTTSRNNTNNNNISIRSPSNTHLIPSASPQQQQPPITPCSVSSACYSTPRTPISPHLLRFHTRTPDSPVLVSVAKQVSMARTTLRRVQECLPTAAAAATKSLRPRVVQLGKDRAKRKEEEESGERIKGEGR